MFDTPVLKLVNSTKNNYEKFIMYRILKFETKGMKLHHSSAVSQPFILKPLKKMVIL